MACEQPPTLNGFFFFVQEPLSFHLKDELFDKKLWTNLCLTFYFEKVLLWKK